MSHSWRQDNLFFPGHLLIDMLGEMRRSVADKPEFWLCYVWGIKTSVKTEIIK